MARILKIGIVVFCAVMTAWLFSRQPAFSVQAAEDLGSLAQIASQEGPVWAGIYFVDKKSDRRVKIGYGKSETKETENGWLTESESRLSLRAQGQQAQMRVQSRVLTDKENRLLSLDFTLLSDAVKFEMFGRVEGKTLQMTIRTAAGEQVKTLDIEGDTVLPETILAHAVRRGLSVGDTVSVPFFDPTTFSYSQAKLTVAEKTTLPESGDAPVYRLTADYMGIEVNAWVDGEGRTLREEAAGLLTKLETEEQALTSGWDRGSALDTDLVEIASVRTTRLLEDARGTKLLSVKLGGIDPAAYGFPDHRQTLEGDVLTIRMEDVNPSTYTLPDKDESMAAFLAPTPTIQSDDRSIRAKAREIVGEETDPLRAAKLLADWVYKNIEKKPLISIPSAKDVLDIKRGDCNEHATLYTALARASGIPTRIEVGLVWHQKGFYYHAWNAVYTGQWIAIDPTFGQFPADASHIKVLSGDLDAQVPIVSMIGSITIDILEVQ